MLPERPETGALPAPVRAYIAALEAELARLRPDAGAERIPVSVAEAAGPAQLISISKAGFAKRTPRHLYGRQRRSGMGIFDLELRGSDVPEVLALAGDDQHLLLVTSRGRAHRLTVNVLPATPVRGRGHPLAELIPLQAEENICCALVVPESGYVAFVSVEGYVRTLPAHLLGDQLRPDFEVLDVMLYGAPAAACIVEGGVDVLVATSGGRAIRFASKLIGALGVQSIRLENREQVVGLAAVTNESQLFLLGADGHGSVRPMNNFASNKAPGAGGKLLLKTARLVSVACVHADGDLFVISRLCKLIRFAAAEVPASNGVVQGVDCMALRADETVALAASEGIHAGSNGG